MNALGTYGEITLTATTSGSASNFIKFTGSQTFTKYGPGTLELGGFAPNLNAAAVVVNEGTLRFNKPTNACRLTHTVASAVSAPGSAATTRPSPTSAKPCACSRS